MKQTITEIMEYKCEPCVSFYFLLPWGHPNQGRQAGFWGQMCAGGSHSWIGIRSPQRCINLGLIFRVGDSEGLGLRQGICISHKFLHDADAAEPRLSLWEPLLCQDHHCIKRLDKGLGFSTEYVQTVYMSFPDGASGKELTCLCSRHKAVGSVPWVRKVPWRRAGQPHGWRNLIGYSPWGCQGSKCNWSDSAHTPSVYTTYDF